MPPRGNWQTLASFGGEKMDLMNLRTSPPQSLTWVKKIKWHVTFVLAEIYIYSLTGSFKIQNKWLCGHWLLFVTMRTIVFVREVKIWARESDNFLLWKDLLTPSPPSLSSNVSKFQFYIHLKKTHSQQEVINLGQFWPTVSENHEKAKIWGSSVQLEIMWYILQTMCNMVYLDQKSV